ncbi:transposase [Paenibacillus mesophilus]|uniref:IS4 family transposase n=1 Tax=Paenibacillus mesophilus TaxID=2582849 RepID=UPI00110E4895|nr:transposase [Paenibacillus mesophilus]TMV51292.1 transposase [Paenibacillus mesophilus]
MLHHISLSEKCEERFSSMFATLKLGNLLRQAGIRKSFGLPALAVFQLIFTLVFQQRSWSRLLESSHRSSLPGKDVVYRFLNHPGFAWRRFFQMLSLKIVQHFESLTSATRIRAFIVDDSVLKRNRCKKAELLARVHDHTTGRFVRGYNMLTLGWSDGFSFAPIDFVMLSSAKLTNRFCEMKERLSKRTQGYKRRMEAFSRKPDAVVALLDRALQLGFAADFVLMDSWFTQAPLLRSLMSKGLHVIGMIKDMKQRYQVGNKRMSLKELHAGLPRSTKKELLGSILVRTDCGLPIKLVFVQNRNSRREWLAILSTDVELTDAEVVRIYGIRWNIETFFKFTKSYLKLGTEFQGRSFDMLISHTTIVFTRYLLMEWERREHQDQRSLGGLFFQFSDEVRDLDLKAALQQIFSFFLELSQTKNKREKSAILSQVQQWISSLPSYIKALMPKLSCET